MDAIIDFWKRIQWSFSIYHHGPPKHAIHLLGYASFCRIYFFNKNSTFDLEITAGTTTADIS